MTRSISKIFGYFIHQIQKLHYGRIVVKEIGGIKYSLDLSESIDSALYHYGFYERATSRVLRKYIRPDMTVIEAGANIGAHTFEIAKTLDEKKGIIYSFEPTEYAFSKLRTNFQLNGFKNIVLEQIALSDINEEKEIHRASSPETMPFKASWDLKTGHAKCTSLDRIKFEKLDSYVSRNGIDKLHLIKMDVDGYELKVVRGGIDTIEKHKPIMIVEFGTTLERVGDRLEDLVELLSSQGYLFYSIQSNAQYDRKELINIVTQRRTLDCLCLTPDSHI